MNITKLFQKAAQKYPEKIAIIDKNRSVSYDSLLNDVKKTAAYFQSRGIGKGDRVLVFVPMGVDLYRIVLALFYIGASAVFLDEWVSKKRLNLCCELADCKGFIGIPKARLYSIFLKSLRRIPIKLNMKKMASYPVDMTDVSVEDTALITFTTGSTGVPKAADRSHGFLFEQFNALIDEIDPHPGDVDMTVLPIVLFMNLGVGSTSIIADIKMSKMESYNESVVVRQLIDHRVNRVIASPFFIKRLAEYAHDNEVVFDNIKHVFTGGAPVFPADAQLFHDSFSKAAINLVYGSTEAEPISSIEASDLKNRTLDVGLPVGKVFHKTDLMIIAIQDGEIETCTEIELSSRALKEGGIGEIIVAGNHVLKRYFSNEQAFRENKIVTDRNIWHRTGDSGFLIGDELYLTGRCKQLIDKDGNLISPFIVENMLKNIDGIDNGTMLDVKGDLVLVVESRLPEIEIVKHLSNIEFDRIVRVKKIPRDPRHNSKIDYESLMVQVEL